MSDGIQFRTQPFFSFLLSSVCIVENFHCSHAAMLNYVVHGSSFCQCVGKNEFIYHRPLENMSAGIIAYLNKTCLKLKCLAFFAKNMIDKIHSLKTYTVEISYKECTRLVVLVRRGRLEPTHVPLMSVTKELTIIFGWTKSSTCVRMENVDL